MGDGLGGNQVVYRYAMSLKRLEPVRPIAKAPYGSWKSWQRTDSLQAMKEPQAKPAA